eukprot:COSAG05_NODE_242_length_13038_cov_60.915140_2_plen_1425_part_00
MYFFFAMYRVRSHLNPRKGSSLSEGTQTDPLITQSTGDAHRDANRTATRVAKQLWREERARLKTLARRLKDRRYGYGDMPREVNTSNTIERQAADHAAGNASSKKKKKKKQMTKAPIVETSSKNRFGLRDHFGDVKDKPAAQDGKPAHRPGKKKQMTKAPIVEMSSKNRFGLRDHFGDVKDKPAAQDGKPVKVKGTRHLAEDAAPASSIAAARNPTAATSVRETNPVLSSPDTEVPLGNESKDGIPYASMDADELNQIVDIPADGLPASAGGSGDFGNDVRTLMMQQTASQKQKPVSTELTEDNFDTTAIEEELLADSVLPGTPTRSIAADDIGLDLASRTKGGGKATKVEEEEQEEEVRTADKGKWADTCYYCGEPGHWKVDCPKLKADLMSDYTASLRKKQIHAGDADGVGAAEEVSVPQSVDSLQKENTTFLKKTSSQVTVKTEHDGGEQDKKKAELKRWWGKVKADQVLRNFESQVDEVERTEQIKQKFSFLVKDYQPRYYYFECVFLGEKLILTGLLIFVPQGSIAQCYIATLTAFGYAVIQTKYMPYAGRKDNLLKQLCEVQLLMTLLISIVLRTDLTEDVISVAGYDTILVVVNVVLVPGFMFIAAASGLLALFVLLREYANSHRVARKWKQALESNTSEDNIMRQELEKDAREVRAQELEKKAILASKQAREQEQRLYDESVQMRQNVEVDELQRVMLNLQSSYENTANAFSDIEAAIATMDKDKDNQQKLLNSKDANWAAKYKQLEKRLYSTSRLTGNDQMQQLKQQLEQDRTKHRGHIKRLTNAAQEKGEKSVAQIRKLERQLTELECENQELKDKLKAEEQRQYLESQDQAHPAEVAPTTEAASAARMEQQLLSRDGAAERTAAELAILVQAETEEIRKNAELAIKENKARLYKLETAYEQLEIEMAETDKAFEHKSLQLEELHRDYQEVLLATGGQAPLLPSAAKPVDAEVREAQMERIVGRVLKRMQHIAMLSAFEGWYNFVERKQLSRRLFEKANARLGLMSLRVSFSSWQDLARIQAQEAMSAQLMRARRKEEELTLQITATEEEKEAETRRVEALQEQASEHEAAVTKLAQEKAALGQEIEATTSKLSEAQQHDAASMQAMHEQHERKLAELKATMEEEKVQAAKEIRAEERAKYKERAAIARERHKDEMQKIREVLRGWNEMNEQFERAQIAHAEITQQYQTTKEELERNQVELELSNNQVETLENELQAAEGEVIQANQRLQETHTEVLSLKGQIKEMEELATSKEAQQRLEQTTQQMINGQKLRQERAKQEQIEAQSQERLNESHLQIEAVREKTDQLTTENDELHANVRVLQQQVLAASMMRKKFRDHIEKLSADHQRELQETKHKLQAESQSLRDQLVAVAVSTTGGPADNGEGAPPAKPPRRTRVKLKAERDAERAAKDQEK